MLAQELKDFSNSDFVYNIFNLRISIFSLLLGGGE